jgi:hypothetical protein
VFPRNSGTGTAATAYASDNLRVNWAGISSGAGVVTVTGAQYVMVSFPYVSGQIYGIFENQSGDNFNYSLRDVAANVLSTGTVTGNNLPYQIVPLATAAQVVTYATTYSRYPAAKNKGLPVSTGFRFVATSGTAKLVGFLFETPIIEQLPMGNVKLLGTWAVEDADAYIAGYNSGTTRVPKVYTSNTQYDRIAVEATGYDILSPVVRVGRESGQFTLYGDGLAAYSAFETYMAVGTFAAVLQFPVASGAWPNYAGASSASLPLAGGGRRRVLTMQLIGTNASVASTATGIGRFTLIGVDGLKMD